MTKPILAVDIDEVLFPFMVTMLDHTNSTYGLSHSIDEVKDFDLKFWNISASEAIERVHAVSSMDHRTVTALPYAKSSLVLLKAQYQIFIVTSRHEEFRARTEEWLAHNFSDLYDKLIMTGNHYSGRQFRSKAEVCLELGVSMLVDDQLHYAKESAQLGLPCILFGDYPWNQADNLPDGVVRARDWNEVVKALEQVYLE